MIFADAECFLDPNNELEIPRTEETREIIDALRTGQIPSDELFDKIFPAPVRHFSSLYWTSVIVAAHAIRMLKPGAGHRVLDIGSGPGKFCFVGSLLSQAHFVGVEQRPHLVRLAEATAKFHRIERASFICADARTLDWNGYDCIYFYNPFVENLYPFAKRIDHSVELSRQRYLREISWVVERLLALPLDVRIVTYHSYGAEFPPGFEKFACEPWGGDFLEGWVKTT